MEGSDGHQGKAGAKQGGDRDKVKAEREARRMAKLAAKQKNQDKGRNLPETSSPDSNNAEPAKLSNTANAPIASSAKVESKKVGKVENVKPKKQSKENVQAKSNKPAAKTVPVAIVEKLEQLNISKTVVEATPVVPQGEDKSKKVLSKAERRAVQEAQRAAKAAKTSGTKPAVAMIAGNKKETTNLNPSTPRSKSSGTKDKVLRKSPIKTISTHRVKLFNHLYDNEKESPLNLVNSSEIHPSIIRLGVQYETGVVKGSNARCIAFLNAIKLVIKDYQTPSDKEFSRGLEDALQTSQKYLKKCRPLAVSVLNAAKYIIWQITQLPKGVSDEELKADLVESVDTYIRDQIEKAAEAISITVQEKISDGDVILTFGCSSLVQHILLEARSAKRDFQVIVVDARPHHEGLEMLRRLVANDIKCTCVQINAVGFIMPKVSKVLLGAHALLANGYVMSRSGTAQVALIAKHYNVPVLVCCETHKFSERVQTDAFVYNEIGNPSDLVTTTEDNTQSSLANWESIPHLTPLNLYYDVTPPELVTAVVTEIAILPCTSVPVILRIKPSEVRY